MMQGSVALLSRLELVENEWVQGRSEARARFIASVTSPNGIGAEIGVHKGHFSRTLLEASRARVLHLIDPWDAQGPDFGWGIGNRSTADALARVRRELKTEIDSGRVVVHVGYDTDVLPGLPDRCFDWAYIDSSHEFEATLAELDALVPKIRAGGIICGDDWHEDPDHIHHGVCRAVRMFVSSGRWEIFYAASSDQQWAIRRGGEA